MRGLVLGLSLLASAAAAQSREPLLSDTGLDHVAVSPDGTRVAYLASVGDRAKLRVQTLEGEQVVSFAAPTRRVFDLAWAGPEHLMITVDHASGSAPGGLKRGGLGVLALNISSQSIQTLLHDDNAPLIGGRLSSSSARVLPLAMSRPVATLSPPHAHVASLNLNGSCALSLYDVDLASGAARVTAQGSADTEAWVVRPDGRALARAVNDRGGWRVLFRKGAGWKQRYQAPDGHTATLVGLGRKADTALVLLEAANGRRTLVEVSDREAGSSTPVATRFVQPTPIHDPNTGLLIGARANTTGGADYEFLSEKTAQVWARLGAVFPPDAALSLESWTPDFSTMVVAVHSPKGREHHVYQRRTGLVRLLAGPAVEQARELDYRAAAQTALPSPRRLCQAARRVDLSGLQNAPIELFR